MARTFLKEARLRSTNKQKSHVTCVEVPDDRKAYNKDIRLRIAKRTQAIVVFLSGCIPQAQAHRFGVNHHIGCVIVEDRWNVFARERIGCV